VFISFLLVKSSFTREVTSGFELFLFIANIGSFYWIIGIGNAMLSYYPTLSKNIQKSFFKSVFFILQSLGIILAILVYFTKGFNLATENQYLNNNAIGLLSLYIIFYSPTLIIEIKYILLNKYKELIKYGIAIFSLQFIMIFASVILFKDIFIVFLWLTIWTFIRWIWTIIIVFYNDNGQLISKSIIKLFILFSLPIIAHILLGNGMDYIDGILVSKFFNSDQFSVYRYGAREFPIILIIIGAIRSVMIPKAVENISQAAQEIKKKTKKIMIIFFPIAIFLIFFSKYIFVFFYNADYIYSAILFNIYLLIISSRIILTEVFIYAKHKNKILMYVSFFELLLNISLSILLMKYFGIAGIAFATFVSFLASKIYLIIYTQKVLKIDLTRYLDINSYLFLTITLYIAFFISVII